MDLIVLSDFDGTIINIDSCEYILSKFVPDEVWKIYDLKYERGEITLEEAMRNQYGLIKQPKHLILEELNKVVSFRTHFADFMEFCNSNNVRFEIVSAGLDFIITHFLELNGWHNSIKVVSAITRLSKSGITLSFPDIHFNTSNNFKDDLVKYYQDKGFLVIFIGDGSSDFFAANLADIAFAVKHSYLARALQKEENSFFEFSNFQEIINEIQWLTDSS